MMNRRDFLRGRSGTRHVHRPPGVVNEAHFIETCSRCKACADQCPQGIIRPGDGGYPRLDFSIDGCTFCLQCIRACEQGALQAPPHRQALRWPLRVRLHDRCLAEQGVVCQACAESCPQQAIRFQWVVGGRCQVRIETADCTGCGSCLSVCPVAALELHTQEDTHATAQ